MGCYRCGGQVQDREALRDMITALAAGDYGIARILLDRVFTGDDRVAVEQVLARAARSAG